MPPLPKLRIGALDDLAKQLRFAPPETLRRQMERARELAGEIDPAINYPEDWIVFRITAYRPQMEAPAMFVGDALLTDISAFVERLSAAVGIAESELAPGEYMDAAALCARWNVSRKTVDRYRRMGLVALRVKGAAGKPKLVFPMETVRRFEERHAERLAGAGEFARLGERLEARIERCGRLYASAGLSLNQAAERIAKRYQRGHETVRQVLRRRGGRAVFDERGPPDEHERRLIARAYWLCFDPADVAEHLERSRPSVQRVMIDSRAERLRTLRPLLEGRRRAAAPTAEQEAVLKHEAVNRGLGSTAPTDLRELVEVIRQTPAPAAAEERARASAYQLLLSLAAAEIGALPAHGAPARVIDRIETRLRWAARLKAALIASQLGQLARTFESSLGRRLDEIRGGLLRELLKQGIGAIGEAVDTFEAKKGGRLAAAAGMALSRVAVRFVREHEGELAGGRSRAAPHLASGVVIEDWTLNIAPWQRFEEGAAQRVWLEPDPRARAGLGALAELEADLLRQRYGWGGPPLMHTELAAHLGMTAMLVAQRERRAVRRAIAAARDEHR